MFRSHVAIGLQRVKPKSALTAISSKDSVAPGSGTKSGGMFGPMPKAPLDFRHLYGCAIHQPINTPKITPMIPSTPPITLAQIDDRTTVLVSRLCHSCCARMYTALFWSNLDCKSAK